MSDNWGWYFTSEYGRDNILRDELGAASAAAASANRSASRLRSQLAQVQGSMEKRLDALSRAFDAYVELGDIREQLIDFGDTRTIRRDAVQAVESMSAGVVPAPLDPDRYDSSYWLLEAMNAVIAIAAGRRDHQLEEQVVALDPGSELFLVGAAAALGHGAAVVDRLPGALASDGRLDPTQVVVADAVAAGLFGPAGLETLAPLVRHNLDAEVSDWSGWLRRGSQSDDPVDQLGWLERVVSYSGQTRAAGAGRPAPLVRTARDGHDDRTAGGPGRRWQQPGDAPPPAEDADPGVAPPPDDAASRLQALVAAAIQQGSPEERELIERAAALRAQIEDPGSARARPAGSSTDDGDAPVERVLVRDLVLGWTEDDTAPAVEQVAREWVRPHLTALAEQLPDQLARPPLTAVVSSGGWRIEADGKGVDPELVRRSRASVTEQSQPIPGGVWACFVAAGVAVLVGALSMSGSVIAGLVLVVIGLGLAGGGVVLRRRHRAQEVEARERRLQGLTEAVAAAEQQVVAQRDARTAESTEHQERRAALVARLREPVTAPLPG